VATLDSFLDDEKNFLLPIADLKVFQIEFSGLKIISHCLLESDVEHVVLEVEKPLLNHFLRGKQIILIKGEIIIVFEDFIFVDFYTFFGSYSQISFSCSLSWLSD